MMQKKESRLRRSRATRVRIGVQKANRLTVNRTNTHIYAQRDLRRERQSPVLRLDARG